MRIRSFQQMLSEYGIAELDTDDGDSRKEMLLGYPCSVIIEGEFMEFDSLNQWIKANIGLAPINWLVYGKTGYDFGFAEYFFANKLLAAAVAKAVPNIYTIYPHSYPPNKTEKSDGYEGLIAYNPADENAIVVKIEKE